MENRRFTRLTSAFSKKLANLKASVALQYAQYNFVRVHRTLRMTPALAAGVTDRLWSVEELIAETNASARGFFLFLEVTHEGANGIFAPV